MIVSSDGKVAPADPPSWPLAEMLDMAHGHNKTITASLHIESKPAAATFLQGPRAAIQTAATNAAAAVIAAKYDGLQLDIEGLQVESKEGFELFVSSCASAFHNRASLSVTVYGPKLVVGDFATYNVSSHSMSLVEIFPLIAVTRNLTDFSAC